LNSDENLFLLLPLLWALGVLGNQSIELMEVLPSEAVSLMQDYLTGQFGTIEFANRAEAIKQRCASSPVSRSDTRS